MKLTNKQFHKSVPEKLRNFETEILHMKGKKREETMKTYRKLLLSTSDQLIYFQRTQHGLANEEQNLECFECDGCIYYELVRMDADGKNSVYSCSNTDRHCYERLQFFESTFTKLQELLDYVKADIMELKRNPEMISECVGRFSTLTFILELFGKEVVVISNYQKV